MYTIKEAAARSGVGVPLLRAWERRYGVVSPTRTASGYRLYDEEAIQRLSAMRALIADGWSAQQAAGRIRSASKDELAAAVPPSPTSRPTESPRGQLGMPDASARSELVARIVEAARAIDGAGVEAALDDTFGALRFEAAVDDVLMPALRAIGDAWEAGDVTVGGEHATSHAVLRRLALAFEAAGVAATESPVLIGLGPGARHELGPLAFAVAARRAGLAVLYLGADLPIESWVSVATEREVPAAVVGVPRRSDVDRASDVLGALRAARPSMILAVGGGHAGRVTDPGVVQLPDSIGEAADRLRTLLDR